MSWLGIKSLFWIALCGRADIVQQHVQDTICQHFKLDKEPIIKLMDHSTDGPASKTSDENPQKIAALLQALRPMHPSTRNQALIYILLVMRASPQLLAKATAADALYDQRHHLAKCMSVLTLEPMESWTRQSNCRYFEAWRPLLTDAPPKTSVEYKVGEWIEAYWNKGKNPGRLIFRSNYGHSHNGSVCFGVLGWRQRCEVIGRHCKSHPHTLGGQKRRQVLFQKANLLP